MFSGSSSSRRSPHSNCKKTWIGFDNIIAAHPSTPDHWKIGQSQQRQSPRLIFSIEKKLAVSIYRYADCFDLIHQGPLPLPIDGKTSAPKQPFHDPWKPCSGFQGEVLEQLRQRRRQQQRNEFSTALTLNPESALNATETRLTLDTPAHILLGTDGLSRLWDTYGLMTREQAQRLVAQRGLLTLLETLRDFELTAPSGGARGKRRDDASGISLSFL